MAPFLKPAEFHHFFAAIGLLCTLLSLSTVKHPAIAANISPPQLLPKSYLAQADPNQLFQDGWDAYQAHNFEQAAALWQQALTQYQTDENSPGEETTLEALGAVCIKLRQYDQAITHLRPLLSAPIEGANWQAQAAAWSNLALALRMTGNYVEALSVQQQVLNLRQANQDITGEAEALINLGQIYQILGSYSIANASYQQSLNLISNGQSRQTEVILLASMGAISADQGDYGQALTYYKNSQTLAESVNDLKGQAYALSNLGATYFTNQKDHETALQYWNQSLALAEQISDNWLIAKDTSDLGLVYEKLQRFEEAIVLHNQSQELLKKLGSNPDIAMSLNNQAHTFLEWGKFLRKSGESSQASAKFQQAATQLTEAITLLDSIRGALSTDAERVSVFDTQAVTYNLFQQVLIEQDQSDSALKISEQGRSRAFTTLLAEKQQLTSASISLDQLKDIAKTQNATLVEYSLIPEDEFVHQGKLRGTTAELYIWVVQPDGTTHFRRSPIDTQTHRLEDLVKTSRTAIGARNRGFEIANSEPVDSNENLKTLYQLLIAPIQDLLPTDPEKQIVFIPQEDLFLVPFSALVDSSGDYLIQHHTLRTASSIEILALTHQQQAKHNLDQPLTPADLLIVGNPVMPKVWDSRSGQMQTLPPLEGAGQEAIAIADLFHTTALTEAAATEKTIKQRIGTARLVHFATHGLLEYGNPQDSGVSDVPGAIALAPGRGEDGLLTAAEILETLNLQAELVVLSACDTGLGDITGDGVIGLARSLIASGTPSVLVSLWAVPDAPTADLMIDFYKEWGEGKDKAQALRHAMLKTMEKHHDPKDWAAFTLIGEAQ